MQDHKTAEAEKKTLGPKGEEKKLCWKKKLSVRNFFLSVGEKKYLLEKECRLEKKNVGWRILPAIQGMSEHSLECKNRKTAEAGKNP